MDKSKIDTALNRLRHNQGKFIAVAFNRQKVICGKSNDLLGEVEASTGGKEK